MLHEQKNTHKRIYLDEMVLTVGQIPRHRRHQLGRRERGVVATPPGRVYPDMVVDEVPAGLPRVETMIQLHLHRSADAIRTSIKYNMDCKQIDGTFQVVVTYIVSSKRLVASH